nr:EOG090X0E58 [Cyclestheria hislopi]
MMVRDAIIQTVEEGWSSTLRLSPSPAVEHHVFYQIMTYWAKKLRLIILLCIFTCIIGIGYVSYFCNNFSCNSYEHFHSVQFSSQNHGKDSFVHSELDNAAKPLTKVEGVPYEDLFQDDFAFDINGNDVIVFLHIQKTGGTTFGRHLVRDLDLEKPCVCHRKRKRCDCFRPHTRNEQWLFSRYSTGWKCGLHADWTELTHCVDHALDGYEGKTKKRRYFYITVLRDPVHRYLSEFRHVQRGATWKSSRHGCGGKGSTELPHCYKGMNWTGVGIEEFMNCPYNLAHNRQTRMLADLTLVGCYNSLFIDSKEKERIMLASAKANLARMAFFGLTEQQYRSQYIFEETFGLRFLTSFEQYNSTLSLLTLNELSNLQLERIKQLNSLDLELYEFAAQLLERRFEKLKKRDHYFDEHWDDIVNGRQNGSLSMAIEQES